MSDEKIHDFSEMADHLMSLGDPKVVISALLRDAHKDRFDEKTYNNIEESSKARATETGEKRLFIAKGKADRMNPGSLIQFIENEVGIRLGDVGKIDILEGFSYINVQAEVAEVVLDYYKVQNRRKPLVVQAKARTGGS